MLSNSHARIRMVHFTAAWNGITALRQNYRIQQVRKLVEGIEGKDSPESPFMKKKKKPKTEPLEGYNLPAEVVQNINRKPLKKGEEIMYSLEYFREQGKIGGKVGGKATAAKLTPEERSASARRAVQSRWKKHKEEESK